MGNGYTLGFPKDLKSAEGDKPTGMSGAGGMNQGETQNWKQQLDGATIPTPSFHHFFLWV